MQIYTFQDRRRKNRRLKVIHPKGGKESENMEQIKQIQNSNQINKNANPLAIIWQVNGPNAPKINQVLSD